MEVVRHHDPNSLAAARKASRDSRVIRTLIGGLLRKGYRVVTYSEREQQIPVRTFHFPPSPNIIALAPTLAACTLTFLRWDSQHDSLLLQRRLGQRQLGKFFNSIVDLHSGTWKLLLYNPSYFGTCLCFPKASSPLAADTAVTNH